MIPNGDIERLFCLRIAFILEAKVLSDDIVSHKAIYFSEIPKASEAVVISTTKNKAHSV